MNLIHRLFFSVVLLIMPSISFARLNVVTTTEDLAAITREVGGNLVEVMAIAKGYQDPHYVDAKPSYLLKLKKADLFIQIGLELEIGWAPSLLIGSRNPKILPGAPGFLDASEGIQVLEKPTGPIDRSRGDVHPFGNPHYWLDPSNSLVMANRIADKLVALIPGEKEIIQNNLKKFESDISANITIWKNSMEALQGVKVFAYHNTWPYFTKFIGLNVVNFIEPKPGIPPTPSHVKTLIEQGKGMKIPLIIVDPYFDHKLPNKIAKDIGAKLVELSPSVGAVENVRTYSELIDHNIRLLIGAVN